MTSVLAAALVAGAFTLQIKADMISNTVYGMGEYGGYGSYGGYGADGCEPTQAPSAEQV